MSDRENDHFEVNVDELRAASNEHLGASIGYLQETVADVRRTANHDGAFDGGDGMFSYVGDTWANTRIEITRVLDANVENLKLSEGALNEIANRYEEVDLNSAAALNGIAAEGLS